MLLRHSAGRIEPLGRPAMTEGSRAPRSSTARQLAMFGALVTGTAGIERAVFSIVVGQETGAGALLATSALAFGFPAVNADLAFRRPESQDSADQPASAPATAVVASSPKASRTHDGLAVHPQQVWLAQIDA